MATYPQYTISMINSAIADIDQGRPGQARTRLDELKRDLMNHAMIAEAKDLIVRLEADPSLDAFSLLRALTEPF